MEPTAREVAYLELSIAVLNELERSSDQMVVQAIRASKYQLENILSAA